ncbi:mannitol dehydrogenase family protein [Butyrivibrio sp. MC2013]|uniref:mannitol dehydrogenase family protein n=1 Tax=Butyrivibrio sp. MC2013 TaxID=1280686 RepID=UPI00047C6B59|nr:mannitol dehydrogenase family protein [Butyrivibrio sp. MC2013]
MKLNEKSIRERNLWEEKGYKLPSYDREKMIYQTVKAPLWVHFGAGNIFRAFHAAAADRLLEAGVIDRGITVVEGYDYEIIDKAYRPADNYSILVTLKSDAAVNKTVVGAIAESCKLDSTNVAEMGRLKEIFEEGSLQLATFTITEKGYCLKGSAGAYQPEVLEDFENGPSHCVSYMGKVAELLYARFMAGAKPIAMVSTDNCSHNGDKLKQAMTEFADKWESGGKAKKGFAAYVNDSSKVSFPWTMIDKITPRPDPEVEKMLRDDGLEGLEPEVTSKNTYVAPFVNAEETEYLVIEDSFPNGRPDLEKAGFILTDRETVDKVERMKVCTCLNPLHTALAVFGCLLGYKKISDEMKDNDLIQLVDILGYKEGLPVVTDPGVLSPREFIDTVVKVRLPNPFMPDTPQRIATDTSQKLSIRYGETIKNYIKDGRDITGLKAIPLVFAGWLRYLMAVDDEGSSFELSPDPMLEELTDHMSAFAVDDKAIYSPEGDKAVVSREALADARAGLSSILTDERIFGIDLEATCMADTVTELFIKMTRGKGAVRAVLREWLS